MGLWSAIIYEYDLLGNNNSSIARRRLIDDRQYDYSFLKYLLKIGMWFEDILNGVQIILIGKTTHAAVEAIHLAHESSFYPTKARTSLLQGSQSILT